MFKRQLQALPEREREKAFSSLSGIPELADIIGRPTPMAFPAQRPTQPVQPRMTDVPLWQKALQAVSAPFQWIGEHITEPFGALVTAPFTPGLPGGRQPGESVLAYARRQYEKWEEPTWTMPWGARFRPTKGLVETLPWLAVPSAAGILGKAGMAGVKGTGLLGLAQTGGQVGRAAGLAAKVVKPVAMAEAVPGKIIGGVAKRVLPKKAITVEAEKLIAMPRASQLEQLSRADALLEQLPRVEPSKLYSISVSGGEVLVRTDSKSKALAMALILEREGENVVSNMVLAEGKGLAGGRAVNDVLKYLEKNNIKFPPRAEMSPQAASLVDAYLAKKVTQVKPKPLEEAFFHGTDRPQDIANIISKGLRSGSSISSSKGQASSYGIVIEYGKIPARGVSYRPGDFVTSARAGRPKAIYVDVEEWGRGIRSVEEVNTALSKKLGELEKLGISPDEVVNRFYKGLPVDDEFANLMRELEKSIDLDVRGFRGQVGGEDILRDVQKAARDIPVGRLIRDAEGDVDWIATRTGVPAPAVTKWKITESNGNTFISDTPIEVGQKTSGTLYATKVEKVYAEQAKPIIGIGGIPPTKPPKPIASAMFPEGIPEPQAAGIKWLTDLTKKAKPLTRETLELRKPEHAFRSAEYKRILDEKIAGGMPIGEARKVALTALEEEYSKAPLTPAFLELLAERGKYEATLLKMIYDTPFQYGFEWENAFAAYWKLVNEGHLQMNQIQTLERVFGPDLAKALLEKHRTLGQKIWFNFVDAFNIPRGLLSMADISGFGRQGWILTTTRPDKALKAVKPMLWSMYDPKNAVFFENVFLKRPHTDKVLKVYPDFMTKWAGEATDIGAREEGFASRLLNKFPGIGQVYKGSTRAYTTVLNDLRTANVSAAISHWEKKGFKYLSPEEATKMFADDAKAIFKARFYTDTDIYYLARTVSWASGRGSLPSELARHAGIANAVFFAPKLIASRVEFPLAILPFVNPSRLARGEAMRELLSFVGSGAGILMMAKLSGQADIELDPRSPDFGKMKVGDTRLDIWTGYSQYLRFIAQMATAQGKTETGRITAKDRSDLIFRFARSKLSPTAGLFADWVSGETFLGEDMPPKSSKSIRGQIYQRMMPLAIQDLVDGYLEDSWSGGLISAAGFLGVGVVTYTDEAKRARDKAAREQYGMSWDEVGRQLGRATQLRLEQTSPAIKEAVEEHEDRFAGATPTTMDTFRSFGDTTEETYRKDIDNAVREFRATGDGAKFREKVDDASKARRKAYAVRAKMPEFQDIMAYYQQPLSPEVISKMNPGDVLRREYYQKLFALDMYDEFDNYLFDEAEKREQEFVTKYGQQAMDYIEGYQAARWIDKPAELLMLEQAKETLRPYWQITDNVWGMYPAGLKELSDQIQLMERTDPVRARQTLRRYPQILRARELIARYKQMMRERNPAIKQAYRLFYG